MYIADKAFVTALERFILAKGAVGGIAREKGLSLIQTWADAFKHDPALALIRELYLRLLGQGVEFPAQNLDDVVPIITPRINTNLLAAQASASPAQPPHQPVRSLGDDGLTDDERMARDLDRQFREEDAAAAASAADASRSSGAPPAVQAQRSPVPSRAQPHTASMVVGQPSRSAGARGATRTVYRVQELAPGQRVTATATQLTKVRADLAIVRQNSKLLSELLRGLGPTERARDNELIAEVATTCASMQTRVTELCERIDNEDLIVELLGANDELNDAQHELRVRTSQESPGIGSADSAADPSATSTTIAAGPGPAGTGAYNSWLPGGQTQATAIPPSTDGLGSPVDADHRETPEFDMFAQTRGMSMSDRMQNAPGYVTGDERTLDEHSTFNSAGDSSLGAAMYNHLGPHDGLSAAEPSYMEVAPSFLPKPQSSHISQFDPMAMPGSVSEPEYAEITPSPGRDAVALPGQVSSPDDAFPTIYDGGSTRQLSDAERRRLDQRQDDLFSL